MYCENCKIHTGNMFSKTLILILKNKIKRKIKCVICLTNGMEDKYDLESELEIYLLSFLLTDVINEHGDLLCEVKKRY